jgi:tetratricopeptide (TPR) repeat protein
MTDPLFADPFAKATYIHNLGMQEWRAGRLEEALGHFKRALALKEEISNVSAAASTIHMIGVIYAQKKDWENATRYLLRSLEIDADDRHYDGVAISLNDIAVMCSNRGETEAKTALVELGNLILKHKRGEAQLNKETAMKFWEKAPSDLREGIQKAVHRLMRWR